MAQEAVPYQIALKNYRAGAIDQPPAIAKADVEALLSGFHPDRHDSSVTELVVGPNKGDPCHCDVAAMLQSNALIEEADLAGAAVRTADVLVIGSGGAGCTAALTAGDARADVIVATKLRLGDSNSVMAEGGIQAAIDPDDSPQAHYDDTLRAGHYAANRRLVAQLVMDGPHSIQWLIKRGMRFTQVGESPFDNLALKRPGGGTAPRVLSYGDFTGLEMMRVLREAVRNHPSITVLQNSPVIELLSDDRGHCVGGVLYDVSRRELSIVKAAAVVLGTGGLGRTHLNGFSTSNHFGAMGDGLVLGYRMGAKLREMDSFQYHPTGVAHPAHLAGGLVSEAARSAGAWLINGLGDRFIDELQPRDVVSASIIRECSEGRGVVLDGCTGVLLDTPGIERQQPGALENFKALSHLAEKCGVDPAIEPLLVYPTLHYQNGGLVIDGDGCTTVPGLLCAGEASGGVHGRNRLMGNALLDIISFGRKAGAKAAEARQHGISRQASLQHVMELQRELTREGLPLERRAPALYPDYANFRFRDHLEARI